VSQPEGMAFPPVLLQEVVAALAKGGSVGRAQQPQTQQDWGEEGGVVDAGAAQEEDSSFLSGGDPPLPAIATPGGTVPLGPGRDRVHVLGTVVAVYSNWAKKVGFVLDDGTAAIACIVWEPFPYQLPELRACLLLLSPPFSPFA
jgi:hypothetical protein